MVRITRLGPDNGTLQLRVEGRIIGPWVEELRNACLSVNNGYVELALHLGDLSFVDRDGARLLLELRARGAVFLECPAFIDEELKSVSRLRAAGRRDASDDSIRDRGDR